MTSRLRAAFRRATRYADNAEKEYGNVGDENGLFEVEGRPNYIYATVIRGGTQTVVQALNEGAPEEPGFPIVLKRLPNGESVAVGPDAARAAQFIGSNRRGLGSSPHGHYIGSHNEDWVE